jgi:hypothetical protein
MTYSSARRVQTKVAHALQHACIGTDLAVSSPDSLTGASVIGEISEAYVIAVSRGGYQVEVWTHDGDDAHQIVPFARLGDAVRHAVDAVTTIRSIAA